MDSVVAADTLEAANPHSRFTSGPAIVLYLAFAKLLFHLFTATRYGIFRDEMYYLACSQHLAWGYVDHPPMNVFISWFARHAFGDSLLGLRLLPAIAGATLVWMTGLLAREMGGSRFAQALAALAVIPVPIYLIMHHWLTMNAFEPPLWMGCLLCVVRAINRSEPRYWFWFGTLTGIGLETKYSIVFLVFGIFVGVLFSPDRHFLKSGWLWLGMLVGAIIALPNFVWQLQHDFPFLQLLHNIRMGNRDIVRGPLSFLADQAAIMNPILLPLWGGRVALAFFVRDGRRYRQRGRRQAAEWLAPLKDQVADGGLGHISEIFDGDAPQRPCGCIRAGVERGRGSPGVRGGCKGSAAEVAPETQRSSDKSSQLNRWNTEDCCGDLIDRIGGYCSKGENGISRQLRAIFLVSE